MISSEIHRGDFILNLIYILLRSLELFRRCDVHSDKMAENLFISWKSGDFSSLPIKVAVQNITYCRPREWKVRISLCLTTIVQYSSS